MKLSILNRLRSRHESVLGSEFLILGHTLVNLVGDPTAPLAEHAFSDAEITSVSAGEFTVCSTAPLNDDDPRFLFDGYFFDWTLHHARHRPPTHRLLARAMRQSASKSGVYVVARVDVGRGEFELRTDLLAQYPVFLYRRGKEFGVSNNPYALEAALRAAGTPATRSAEAVCLNVTYLSAFGRHTSFGDLELLPPRHGLRFSRGGLQTFEYVDRNELFESKARYDDLLDEAAAEIAKNCAALGALAKQEISAIADLTGGVDTRLVLGGLLKTGFERSVGFVNVNTELRRQSPDAVVAEQLMRHYRLEPGTAVTADGSYLSLNSRRRFSYGGALAYGAGHYFGVLPAGHEDYGELYLDHYCRAGGYCGEHTRAVGPNIAELLKEGTTAACLASAYFDYRTAPGKNNGAAYLTSDGLGVFHDALNTYFRELASTVSNLKLVNTITYMENRSRFHFGARIANANRSRISVAPLVAPNLLKLHGKLTYRELRHNRIAHDLLIKLGGPELAYFPFASFRWGRHATGRERYEEYLRRLDAVHTSVPVAAGRSVGHPTTVGPTRGRATSPYDAWLKGSDASAPRCKALEFLLEALPRSDRVWNLVDRAAVEAEARAPEVRDSVGGEGPHRWREWNIDRLVTTLTFYGGYEMVSRLQDHVDVRDARTPVNAQGWSGE